MELVLRSDGEPGFDLSNLASKIESLRGGERSGEYLTTLKFLHEVLSAIPNSWRQEDPGKYEPAYWLTYNGQRALVREFIAGELLPAVPLVIANFDDIDRQKCPSCEAEEQVVVLCYRQTFDSPDGDTWCLRDLIMCLECENSFVIDEQQSSNRIL